MIQFDEIKGMKYRVTRTFSMSTGIIPVKTISSAFCSLDEDGKIIIRKGFCWDGATGAIDTPSIMHGSCVHDVFCNWFNEGLITKENRKQADQLFKTINKQEHMPKIRVKWVYQAVRKFFELFHRG